MSRVSSFFAAVVCLVGAVGCGSDVQLGPALPYEDSSEAPNVDRIGPTTLVGSGAVNDFQLPDENPTSARFTEVVSPRDYLGEISAYFFLDAY